MIRPFFHKACEEIDAGIFSGDTLYVDEERAMLKDYVARWQRAIDAHEVNDGILPASDDDDDILPSFFSPKE